MIPTDIKQAPDQVYVSQRYVNKGATKKPKMGAPINKYGLNWARFLSSHCCAITLTLKPELTGMFSSKTV